MDAGADFLPSQLRAFGVRGINAAEPIWLLVLPGEGNRDPVTGTVGQVSVSIH